MYTMQCTDVRNNINMSTCARKKYRKWIILKWSFLIKKLFESVKLGLLVAPRIWSYQYAIPWWHLVIVSFSVDLDILPKYTKLG